MPGTCRGFQRTVRFKLLAATDTNLHSEIERGGEEHYIEMTKLYDRRRTDMISPLPSRA
jgi:hypothetical protein